MPKPRILQLSEYDITQRMMESLSNVCSRAILFSVKERAKDAAEISAELGLSLSAVYVNLQRLENLALIKQTYQLDGKRKIKVYQSRVSRIEILMNGGEPELKLFPSGIEADNGTSG